MKRRRSVHLRFYAGGRGDETPRAVVVAGEEEPVEVLRSTLEEHDGTRIRRFRLKAADEVFEVSAPDGSDRWRVEGDIPADIMGAAPAD